MYVAPPGFRIIHRHHDSYVGGSVVFVSRDDIERRPADVGDFGEFDCLVINCSHRLCTPIFWCYQLHSLQLTVLFDRRSAASVATGPSIFMWDYDCPGHGVIKID